MSGLLEGPDILEAVDTSDEEDDDGSSATSNLPSCLESLTSSSDQLQQLANHLGRHRIAKLLCHGYTTELNDAVRTSTSSATEVGAKKMPPPELRISTNLKELNKDQAALKLLETTVEALPFLNELCTLIEQCFMTIESTIKRSTYYLNKTSNEPYKTSIHSAAPQNEFQLTSDIRIHPIFVSLMDLTYAMISLDKTIQWHAPGICASLTSLKTTCELIIQTDQIDAQSIEDDDKLKELPKSRIANLIEYINNIQLTLCNQNRSIFQQSLEHLQHLNLHLSLDKTSKGYKNLCEHFEGFIEFYGEHLIESSHQFGLLTSNGPTAALPSKQLKSNSILLINLNLIPTEYMTSASNRLFGLTTLFILYSWLFKKPNKRLVQIMMQTLLRFKSMNFVHLLGSNCYLRLDEFLSKHLPKSLLDTRILKQLKNHSEQELKCDINDKFEKFTMKVMPWLVQFKAQSMNNNRDKNHEKLLDLFQRGLKLAEEINYSIKSSINTYLHHNKPMSKNQLVPLIRMVALLKSIEDILMHNQLFFYQCSMAAEKYLRSSWHDLITGARKRLISLKYSDRPMDTNSLLTLTSICSRVVYLTTNWGRRILSLGLSMLRSTLSVDELGQMNLLLSNIYPITMYECLKDVTNCGYLYWSWPTLSTYYNYAIEENPCAIDEIHYLHLAVNDMQGLFSSLSDTQLKDNSKSKDFLNNLEQELVDQFKCDFLDKLCQEFEMELRLQTHRELHLDGHNPFRRHLHNFKLIFSGHRAHTTFRIFNQQISLRHYVEQYLNRVCYNLTAIAPHDWFTYDSMINLAKIRYDLHLANTQLPTQSLDCGLDLLDVTRHLALFVSRYGYDLANQLFIEKCSNRLSTSSAASVFSGVGGGIGGVSMLSANTLRSSNLNLSLNVIQVKHIAKSIQTHGYGVLNSSVNCTYQVMKRLVNLFAKQMSDDKLRASLTKEHLALNSGKQSGISFEKASRMAKKFKLNLTNHATSSIDQNHQQHQIGSDLDSLRQSITQLGNLLGFIRMLKSGALSCASRSADYLPDLDNIPTMSMSKLVESEFGATSSSSNPLSQSLYKASENFDQCLADLHEHFSSKTNYFGIVIDLFRQTLADGSGSIGKPSDEQHSVILNGSNAEPQGELAGGSQMESSTPKSRSSPIEDKSKESTGNTDRPRKSSNKREHLNLFSTLVPALTINYIDHLINCKERASSRSTATRFGALISDDGFSMGVAFLLTVLGQSKSFAKLEWFKEIEANLAEDKREIGERIQDSKYEESLKQTASMTLRRLNRLQIEYSGLNNTLNSALLFFRSSTFVKSDETMRG